MSSEVVDRIRELEKSVAASRENINGIADLLKFLEVCTKICSPLGRLEALSDAITQRNSQKGADEGKFYSLKALSRIFSRLVDADEIVHTASIAATKKAKGSGDAAANVSLWLRKKYFSFINAMLVLLHNDEPGLQVRSASSALMPMSYLTLACFFPCFRRPQR